MFAETKIKMSKPVKNCKTSLFALMIAKFALLIPRILKLANVTYVQKEIWISTMHKSGFNAQLMQ